MRAADALLAAACLLLASSCHAQRRQKLTDENFEHITQAATGQTTGVWFVNFCSTSARACKELAPVWEELGKELLQRQAAFLTTVDPHKNPRLRERFGITHLPTLLLLRDRKMYRYTDRVIAGPELKDQLKQWLQHGYSQGAGEAVPPPAAALDWLLKGLQAKVAHLRHALETQDMRALALHLLPILGVCLLGVLLMLGSAVRRAKPKRE